MSIKGKMQKWFHKDEADDEDSIVEESMKDGDHGTILGIKPKIINGVAIFFVVTVCAAFFWAANEDDAQTQKAKSPAEQKQEIVDAAKTPAAKNSQFPDDYEELAAAEREYEKRNGGGQGSQQFHQAVPQEAGAQQARQAAPAAQTTRVTVPENSYPAVAYARQYPVYPQSQPTAAPAASAEKDARKELESKLASAIAFATDAVSESSAAPSDQAATGTQPGMQPTGTDRAASSAGSMNGTYTAMGPNMIGAGTMIPVMLLTGINTDTPGQVMAQVQSDVYDSYSGTQVIIPSGSRFIGSYDAASATNGRVGVKFGTLVLPGGGSWAVGDSLVAVDGAGYMGISGKVHHHTGRTIGKGLLNSAMTALSTLAVDRVTLDMSSIANTTGSNTVKETVTVEPGYEFQVYVTNTIAF